MKKIILRFCEAAIVAVVAIMSFSYFLPVDKVQMKEEVKSDLFISGPSDLTFNSQKVFITVMPNQEIYIISSVTTTNEVWPKPVAALHPQYRIDTVPYYGPPSHIPNDPMPQFDLGTTNLLYHTKEFPH